MVEAVIQAAGLKKGEHFKTQHKSAKGSDTDFVFPNVADFRDQDVEIFLAVQFSTNDRARLVGSELKPGAEIYVATGNGLTAATKGMKDIGRQIIEDYKNKNIKIVCYDKEIEKEKIRLQSLIAKNKEVALNSLKLDYMENFTISYADFAKKISKRYLTTSS